MLFVYMDCVVDRVLYFHWRSIALENMMDTRMASVICKGRIISLIGFKKCLHVFVSNYSLQSLKFNFQDIFALKIVFFCVNETRRMGNGEKNVRSESMRFSILGTSSCGVMRPPWENIADQLRYEMKIGF